MKTTDSIGPTKPSRQSAWWRGENVLGIRLPHTADDPHRQAPRSQKRHRKVSAILDILRMRSNPGSRCVIRADERFEASLRY
jgi:hypothetical protein